MLLTFIIAYKIGFALFLLRKIVSINIRPDANSQLTNKPNIIFKDRSALTVIKGRYFSCLL
jgi:hypothetical protein